MAEPLVFGSFAKGSKVATERGMTRDRLTSTETPGGYQLTLLDVSVLDIWNKSDFGTAMNSLKQEESAYQEESLSQLIAFCLL